MGARYLPGEFERTRAVAAALKYGGGASFVAYLK